MRAKRMVIWSAMTAQALSGQMVINPIPGEAEDVGIGAKLERWVRIPNSPGVNRAPRMNMLRDVGDGRMLVNDQRGMLYQVDKESGEVGIYLEMRFSYQQFSWIELDAWQTGFSSFALHPEFLENGIFYTVVSVAAPTGTPTYAGKRPIPGTGMGTRNPSHHDVLLRWQAADPTAVNFAGTVRELMRIEQPYGDHNVGEIAFNPLASAEDADYGMLYIATGDGGWVYLQTDPDPQRNAGDLSSPLGKILRIDPEGSNGPGGTYGIPNDNPFVGAEGALPEIWAYGLRNPHRFNWDMATGNLYAYDIGGAYIEEVNLIVKGSHYGWSNREGTWVQQSGQLYALTESDEEDYLYPIAQYAHPAGSGAISGGYVYRGTALPYLRGQMLFVDFTAKDSSYHVSVDSVAELQNRETLETFKLTWYDEEDRQRTLGEIVRGGKGQRSDARFGTDTEGNLYLLNKHNGWIYKITAAPGALPLNKQASWYFDPDNGWVYIDFNQLPWVWYQERGGWFEASAK